MDIDFLGSFYVIKVINDFMFFVMGDLLVCFWFYDVGEFWEGFDIGLDMDFLDIEWFGDLVFFVVGRK